MDLALGGSRVPSSGGAPVLHAGVAVTRGRVTLGRLRDVVGPAPGPVTVVAGLRSVCWVGPTDAEAPELGRLVHRVTSRLDARGRLLLDRHTRAYLGVADPNEFDVVLISLPTGGLVLAPLEDLEARLARVEIP